MSSPSVETNSVQQPVTWRPGLLLTLILCLLGAAIGGAVVHQFHPLFLHEDLPPIGLGASAELVEQHRNAEFEYRSKNYGMELAIVGLAFGSAFGVISTKSKFVAILIGAFVGALTGGVLGFFGGRFVAQALFQNQQQTLQESIGLQASVWGLMLGGIVWSVAAVNVGLKRSTTYGLLGLFAGIVVAVGQFVLSSIMFPASNPLFLVPEESTERLYWMIAFPIFAGPILAFGLSQDRSVSPAKAAG